MDPIDTSDALGQQTAAEMPGSDGLQQGDQSPEGGSPQHEGLQKRIDELTRKRHEAERKAEQVAAESQARIDQLMALVTSRAAAPQVPETPPDISPEEQQKIDYIVKRSVGPELKELKEQNAMLRQLVQQQQFGAAASKMDPRVVERANWLMKNSKYGDLVNKGVATAEDVLTFAFGEVARQDAQNGGRARNERGQFNQAAGNTMMGQSAAPPPPVDKAALPKNFESLSPDQQAAILEKRLDGQTF